MGNDSYFCLCKTLFLRPCYKSILLALYSSTQHPTGVQETVAFVLGIPQNKVVCKAKRLGGGFGGKEERSTYIASYAAIAAYKLVNIILYQYVLKQKM